MRKLLLLLGVAAVLPAAGGAAGAARTMLPPPALTLKGVFVGALAASGATVALGVYRDGVSACGVELVNLARPAAPAAVRGLGTCSTGDAAVRGVWLSQTTVAATVVDSPSPHGDSWTFWSGPRPSGPLREQGDEWYWTDSDVPFGDGCAQAVVSGGGTIATAEVPNRLAVDQGLAKRPACPASGSTDVELRGAHTGSVTVAGSWRPLATDGRRLVLARLGADARPAGDIRLVDAGGKALPITPPDPALVRAATSAWLTAAGLVLRDPSGIWGPGWHTGPARAATVAEGRLVYLAGGTLRVRRLSGAPDRVLLRLPSGSAQVAAGSFGVAITLSADSGARLYRLPWRTIDRTLTA